MLCKFIIRRLIASIPAVFIVITLVLSAFQLIPGDAALSEGIVAGKSSRFAEHVVCSFDQKIAEKLVPEDQILIQAFGVGLELPDFKDIMIRNPGPELLKRINVREADGKLSFPVRAVFENEYGGAGAGYNSNNRTASIMVSQEILKENEIDTLCFGDFVAINNWDSRFRTCCQYAGDICALEKPEFSETTSDHFVACHLPLEHAD